MGQVAGDVSGNPVPHLDGRDVCQRADHLFVSIEVLAEGLGILVDEIDSDSLDVGGSYSSHIIHRVGPD